MFRLKKNLTSSIAIKLSSFGLAVPAFAVITKNLDPVQAAHWFIIFSIIPVFLIVSISSASSLTNTLSMRKAGADVFDEFEEAVTNTKIIGIRLTLILLITSTIIGEVVNSSNKELYYGASVLGSLFLMLSPIQLVDSVLIAKGRTYKVQLYDLAITLIFLACSYISVRLGLGLYVLCVIYPLIYYSVRLIGYVTDKDAAPYITLLRKSYIYTAGRKLSISKDFKRFLFIGIFNIIGTSLDLFLVNQLTEDPDAVITLAFFQRLFLIYTLVGSAAMPFWPYLNYHIANGDAAHAIKITLLLEICFLFMAILISGLLWINKDNITAIFLSQNLAVSSSLFFLALLTRTLTLMGEGFTPIMQTQQLVSALSKITVAMCSLSIAIKPFALTEYGLMGLLITNSILFGIVYLGLGFLSVTCYVNQKGAKVK